jgi:hypothetical protein
VSPRHLDAKRDI